MPVALVTPANRQGVAVEVAEETAPRPEPKFKGFLKKIFASSGSSMLAKGAMGTHEIVEIDNDIPDNLIPSIVKHHRENPKVTRASGDARGYHETSVNELQYLAGDFVSIQRNAATLTDQIRHTDKLSKQSHVEGMTSAVGVITGYVASMRGHVEAKESYHLEDKGGLFSGIATAIRGPFESIGNGSSAVASGLKAFETPAKVASMTKVFKGLTVASTVGSGFFYLLLGAPAAYSAYESGAMMSRLKRVEKEKGSVEAFKLLQDKLRINNDDRKKVLDELFVEKEEGCLKRAARRFFDWVYSYDSEKTKVLKESLKEIIEKREFGSEEMKQSLRSIDPNDRIIKLLTKEDRKFIAKYINDHFKDKPLTSSEREHLIRMIAVFYKAGMNVISARKEKQFQRMMGSDALKIVKSHLGTKDPSKIGLEKVQEAIKLAKKGLVKSLIINISIVVGCVLGMVGMLIGTILTAGIFPLISTVISLVTLGVWTGLDGYTLYQEYKTGTATTKDKVLMVLSTVMMIGIVVVGNFAAGVAAVALTAAFTVAWTMLLLYTIYNWKRKAKKEPQPEASLEKAAKAAVSKSELEGIGIYDIEEDKLDGVRQEEIKLDVLRTSHEETQEEQSSGAAVDETDPAHNQLE